MGGGRSDWRKELGRFLKPFLDRLGHKARRQMCPVYVSGLVGPGDRKSIQPMAERLAPGDYDQLHHFIATGVWDAAPLERELLVQADRLVGGSDAVLVIDDTAIAKKGTHSVGVAAQYASALGKTADLLAARHSERARPAREVYLGVVPLSVAHDGLCDRGRGTALISSPKSTARTPVIGGVPGGVCSSEARLLILQRRS